MRQMDRSNKRRFNSPRYVPRTINAGRVTRRDNRQRSRCSMTTRQSSRQFYTLTGTFRYAKENNKCNEGRGTRASSTRNDLTSNSNFKIKDRRLRRQTKDRRTSSHTHDRSNDARSRNRFMRLFRTNILFNAMVMTGRQTRALRSTVNKRVRRNLRLMMGTRRRRMTLKGTHRRTIRRNGRREKRNRVRSNQRTSNVRFTIRYDVQTRTTTTRSSERLDASMGRGMGTRTRRLTSTNNGNHAHGTRNERQTGTRSRSKIRGSVTRATGSRHHRDRLRTTRNLGRLFGNRYHRISNNGRRCSNKMNSTKYSRTYITNRPTRGTQRSSGTSGNSRGTIRRTRHRAINNNDLNLFIITHTGMRYSRNVSTSARTSNSNINGVLSQRRRQRHDRNIFTSTNRRRTIRSIMRAIRRRKGGVKRHRKCRRQRRQFFFRGNLIRDIYVTPMRGEGRLLRPQGHRNRATQEWGRARGDRAVTFLGSLYNRG